MYAHAQKYCQMSWGPLFHGLGGLHCATVHTLEGAIIRLVRRTMVLGCVAVCPSIAWCSVLQCVAVCCSACARSKATSNVRTTMVLGCVAVCCSVLQCQRVAVHCGALQGFRSLKGTRKHQEQLWSHVLVIARVQRIFEFESNRNIRRARHGAI